MAERPERSRLEVILAAREQLLDVDRQLVEHLQQYGRDRCGEREPCLLAFMKLQDRFQTYSASILSYVGTLRASLETSRKGGD